MRGTGKSLCGDHRTQLVALYLMSCPNSNMIGLYYLPTVLIADELGCTPKEARESVQRLSDLGFCSYDDETKFVFVHKMAAHQLEQALNPKDGKHKWVRKLLAEAGSSPLVPKFWAEYAQAYHLGPCPVGDPPRDPPLGPPTHPRGDQEQDQEQFQDQNQEQEQGVQGEAPIGASSAADGGPTSMPLVLKQQTAPKKVRRPKLAATEDSDLLHVFNLWVTLHHKPPTTVLDAKRTSKIKTALKSHGVEQVSDAIAGATLDPWTMGTAPNSPRKSDGAVVKYTDLSTILRDAGTIEKHSAAFQEAPDSVRDALFKAAGFLVEAEPPAPPPPKPSAPAPAPKEQAAQRQLGQDFFGAASPPPEPTPAPAPDSLRTRLQVVAEKAAWKAYNAAEAEGELVEDCEAAWLEAYRKTDVSFLNGEIDLPETFKSRGRQG